MFSNRLKTSASVFKTKSQTPTTFNIYLNNVHLNIYVFFFASELIYVMKEIQEKEHFYLST